MTKKYIEYFKNGRIKHIIKYYSALIPECSAYYYKNGAPREIQFYDEDEFPHGETDTPDFQSWRKNGYTFVITFVKHGRGHNKNNPYYIRFNKKSPKIVEKTYRLNGGSFMIKLDWQNLIKNI
jgi:hypothetical protein